MPPSTARKASLEDSLRRYETASQKLLPFLAARGLGEAARDRFRLGYVEPADDVPTRYWHRLAIPYLTPTGVVQIRYRRLADDNSPKFLGDAGEEVTLYNASATLRGGPVLFITEGEPDVWAIETLTRYPAVGIPGALSWGKHPYWARCFVNFPQLILAADGDEAGNKLADAVGKDLPETRIVRLPDGEDANSLLARDPDDFLRRCGLG